jgi:hypothetical protein
LRRATAAFSKTADAASFANKKGDVSPDACETTRLMELLRDNETFKYVGWELWWEGFEVGEE